MKLKIFVVIFSFISVLVNGQSYYFRHFKNSNGLSNNTITACIQDKRGFVWFGTKDGLTRYDGFQFKIFEQNRTGQNCVKNNFITSLFEDKDGWIWIGTSEGVCYYIPGSDFFGTISSEDFKNNAPILNVKVDKNNCIWIVGQGETYKYNKETRKTTLYSGNEYFIPVNISLTRSGEVWLTSTKGILYKYDDHSDNFTSYKILSEKELNESVVLLHVLDAGNYGLIITSNIEGLRRFEPNTGKSELLEKKYPWNKILIRTACLINEEEIWIGSESGVYIYNLRTSEINNLKMVPTDPFSLSNNAIRSITKDNEGGIWIGTFYGGVNYLPGGSKQFEKYYPTALPGSLKGNVIKRIVADTFGNIWIGTEDAGLIRMDPQTRIFTGFVNDVNNVNIGCDNIQGLMVDNDNLWIGTYDRGIFVLNIPTNKIIKHFDIDGAPNGLKTNSFICFLKTSDGRIFAGSVAGLYLYIPETSSFKFISAFSQEVFIHELYEDSRGNIWVGTYGNGLYIIEKGSEMSRKIITTKDKNSNRGSEYITSIFEDNDNKIWFTTEGNGFSFIDRKTDSLTSFIPGRDVDFAIYCGVLQDGFGKIWITSTRGLLQFDPLTKKITTYTKDDGLLDNAFNYASVFKDKNGKIYLGTLSGMISFCPAEIKTNAHDLPIYFTGFQTNGNELLINSSGSPEFSSILIAKQIRLKYNQSSFNIDFVSPSFTSPNLVKYKYKMEGSDPDWILISGNRKVYYTSLSPGTYRFSVGSSSDGITWSPEKTSLEIIISPPVWLSKTAIILYFIIFGYLIYILINYFVKRNALEQKRKIDIIESNKEKEILNAKITFFTNITHDVRTPLTLIKGPLDRILQSAGNNPKDTEENLLIIKRNTDRLLSLTNQLLDFRKTEKEMFRLTFINTDLYELIESTSNLFTPYSEEKKITVRFHSPVTSLILAVDREAITKILSNLLSNAFKNAESRVDLFLETDAENENIIRIRINNDGRLIPEELKEKIFEPFYRIDTPNKGGPGTGLGLSLARSLAELHHGRLFLDVSEKRYSSFVLELTKNQEETISSNISLKEAGSNENHLFEIFGTTDSIHPNVLLVEDEVEMGRFIAKEISMEYNVILTHNGEEALNALRKYNIFLVVSDVVMPGINGFDLCRQIKSNIEFSHIPVILLTATIHLNARIKGLDSGADAYIEKPFSTDLLIAQISNLIKNKILDRQNFINTPLAHFKSVTVNKTDEEFLKKLHTILIDNLSQDDLSVEKVAELMGISLSTLYRKVKALTDLNTVEYIRLVRLKKAAEFLSEGNYRINEISYLVGFASPSYFATSFQKQFGVSPSQFVKNLK
jgi:signal transduction histidine kinase/ligand-binding sensor domain-containing protein/DNA-binding response OmpR family regulator